MTGASLQWDYTLPKCFVVWGAGWSNLLISNAFFGISLLHLKSRIVQCFFFFFSVVGDLAVITCEEKLLLVIAVCYDYTPHV